MNTPTPALFLSLAILASSVTGQTTAGAIRWSDSSGTKSWHADSVAFGDDTGIAVVAKNAASRSVSIYTATSGSSVFELPALFDTTRVAAAAHDSLVVRTYTRELSGTQTLVGAVEAYEDWSAGKPLWRYDYPFQNQAILVDPFIFVSRDGQRVVSIWGDFAAKRIVVETFGRDGTRQASTVIPGTWWTLGADASDDATRIALRLANGLAVIDTVAGRIEFQTRTSGGTGGITISGNGQRVAYGKRLPGAVTVLDSQLQWAQTTVLQLGDVYVNFMDLNADGERLAFAIQDRGFRAFDTVLYDLPSSKRLFTCRTADPLSQYQLVADGIEVDDVGDTVAVISWGDSNHTTPEIQCYDETGKDIYSQKTVGSALAMDLSPDGRQLLVGNSRKHQNIFSGPGGNVHYIDLKRPGLTIKGQLRSGQRLQVIPRPSTGALVSALAIGLRRAPVPLPAPLAEWLLDPAAILMSVPALPGQAFSLTVPASIASTKWYWQAASLTLAGGLDTSVAITTRFVQ